jgi:predicted dienelactone hydrolase
MNQAALMVAALAVVVAARPVAMQVARPPAIELPAPTGASEVGTTTWRLLDKSRKEPFSSTGEFRQVEVLAWYPAAPVHGAMAPYLREGRLEARSFGALFNAETAFDGLDEVRTHATLDAVPATGPQKFPVLIFSHGYTGAPSSYTALLEDLASHGYAVLSIVHPYEAAAAILTDGRVVSMLGADGKFRLPIQQVFAEWTLEDDTMGAVTRAQSDAEQLKLLRGYLRPLKNTDAVLKRWVDDTRFVLDRLSILPRETAAGQLAARLDLSRIGAFGHSMGGVTSAQFCLEDRRCRAALNLDGIPQYGPMIDGSMSRPLLMVYSERPGRAGANDAIYRHAARPYTRADVRGTRHLDFTDMVFWRGPLRARQLLGTIAPDRAVTITRTIVREYFDRELLGQPSPLLSGTAGFPEVSVRTVPPAGR